MAAAEAPRDTSTVDGNSGNVMKAPPLVEASAPSLGAVNTGQVCARVELTLLVVVLKLVEKMLVVVVNTVVTLTVLFCPTPLEVSVLVTVTTSPDPACPEA